MKNAKPKSKLRRCTILGLNNRKGIIILLLEPGEYNFTVKNMTRGQYTPGPSAKITEPCPMAELELDVTDSKGQTATVKENLILHTSLEWKLVNSLYPLGKGKGNHLFQLGAVIGTSGRGEFDTRKYTANGEEREANQVKNFLEPVTNNAGAAQTQQPQTNAQPTQQQPQSNPGFNF